MSWAVTWALRVPPWVLAATAVAAAAAVIGVTAAARRSVLAAGATERPYPEPASSGQAELRGILQGLGEAQARVAFLESRAFGESRFNAKASLGEEGHQGRPPWALSSAASDEAKAKESSAAKKAYDRNRATLSAYSEPYYTYGSGGWFGMLPANALAKHYPQEHPWSVHEPANTVAYALEFERGLRGWSGFKERPSWATLAVGWGDPSAMGDEERESEVRDQLRARYQEMGYDPDLVDEPVGASSADILDASTLLAQAKQNAG